MQRVVWMCSIRDLQLPLDFTTPFLCFGSAPETSKHACDLHLARVFQFDAISTVSQIQELN
jgi:hypothetical protein